VGGRREEGKGGEGKGGRGRGGRDGRRVRGGHHLQHPVRDDLPHVGLDLLLDHLEVVGGGEVELLDLQHVAEDAGVLDEDGVLVCEGEQGLEGSGWRGQGALAGVPGEEGCRHLPH
jgi:hypothetical protein